jgi:hypothetical protein
VEKVQRRTRRGRREWRRAAGGGHGRGGRGRDGGCREAPRSGCRRFHVRRQGFFRRTAGTRRGCRPVAAVGGRGVGSGTACAGAAGTPAGGLCLAAVGLNTAPPRRERQAGGGAEHQETADQRTHERLSAGGWGRPALFFGRRRRESRAPARGGVAWKGRAAGVGPTMTDRGHGPGTTTLPQPGAREVRPGCRSGRRAAGYADYPCRGRCWPSRVVRPRERPRRGGSAPGHRVGLLGCINRWLVVGGAGPVWVPAAEAPMTGMGKERRRSGRGPAAETQTEPPTTPATQVDAGAGR